MCIRDSKIGRQRGETFNKYVNDEEAAYRKVQKVMNEVMLQGDDEYSSDDDIVTESGLKIQKFRLPKSLRGWLFLERCHIPIRELPAIFNQTKGTHIDKLKRVMLDSFTEKALKALDNAGTAHKSRSYVAEEVNNAEEWNDGWNDWNGSYDDWGSPGTQQGPDEAHNAEDDDDESYDSNDPDLDEDEVAYTDDAGYFYATEEVCDHVDSQLSTEDPEFAQTATNYTTARALMAKARVARGFYPVVVPATDAGSPPQRKGKGKGKGGINEVWAGNCLLYTSPSPRDRG